MKQKDETILGFIKELENFEDEEENAIFGSVNGVTCAVGNMTGILAQWTVLTIDLVEMLKECNCTKKQAKSLLKDGLDAAFAFAHYLETEAGKKDKISNFESLLEDFGGED